MATQTDDRTVQLKNVRLMFADSLYEKRATVEDGEPKHTCAIVIDPDAPEGPKNIALVKSALKAAQMQTWKRDDIAKALQEDDPKRLCFRRGERFKNREGEVYGGFVGMMGISTAGPSGGKKRPKMFDRHKRPVEVDDILDVCYSGTQCDAIISFYGTDKGGKGIFSSVEAIRSRQEGERMGGGVNVDADDFDDLEDANDAFEGTDASTDDLIDL